MLRRLDASAISSRVPHGDETMEDLMPKPDIYSCFTEKVIADLNAGTLRPISAFRTNGRCRETVYKPMAIRNS